jgi:hypothetical protein
MTWSTSGMKMRTQSGSIEFFVVWGGNAQKTRSFGDFVDVGVAGDDDEGGSWM